MKLLNIVGRKSDNATVLPPDIVNAGQAENDGLAHRQHGAGEIARHHYILPRGFGTNWHQATPATDFATNCSAGLITNRLISRPPTNEAWAFFL
jgi:hypothetical protein